MKKSELVKIIKEEITNIILEQEGPLKRHPKFPRIDAIGINSTSRGKGIALAPEDLADPENERLLQAIEKDLRDKNPRGRNALRDFYSNIVVRRLAGKLPRMNAKAIYDKNYGMSL